MEVIIVIVLFLGFFLTLALAYLLVRMFPSICLAIIAWIVGGNVAEIAKATYGAEGLPLLGVLVVVGVIILIIASIMALAFDIVFCMGRFQVIKEEWKKS